MLCTSAVSHCPVPDKGSELPEGGTPHLRQACPQALDLFVRPHRQMDEEALAYMSDFMESATWRLQDKEAVVVGAANSRGYAISDPLVQHLLWRMFKKFGWGYCVMVA